MPFEILKIRFITAYLLPIYLRNSCAKILNQIRANIYKIMT